MRTSRQIRVDRALLQALAAVPAEFLLPEGVLRADTARGVLPRATTAELDEALVLADMQRRIIGVAEDEGMRWKISGVGRAWLAEHP